MGRENTRKYLGSKQAAGKFGINGWAGIFPSEPEKYLTSKRDLKRLLGGALGFRT
jgi:hypothetical protein